MTASTTTISSRSKLKLVILGDQTTGKTSIIERFCNNTFSHSPDPTVGVDFLGKNITHSHRPYRLQLWDTAGQERFRSLIPNYLKDAACAVFVFDLSFEKSLDGMSGWISLWEEYKSSSAVSVLCGNKKDLMEDQNPNMLLKLKSVQEEYPMPYVEVSASTGFNIDYLFTQAVDQITSQSNLQSAEKQDPVEIFPITNKPLKLTQPLPTAVFNGSIESLENKRRERCC